MTNLWTSIPVWWLKHTLLHLFEAPLYCFCFFHWATSAKNILLSVTETLWIKASSKRSSHVMSSAQQYYLLLKFILLQNDRWLRHAGPDHNPAGNLVVHTADWNQGACATRSYSQLIKNWCPITPLGVWYQCTLSTNSIVNPSLTILDTQSNCLGRP